VEIWAAVRRARFLAGAVGWEVIGPSLGFSFTLTIRNLAAFPISVTSLTLVMGCKGSMMLPGQPSGVLHP
jgi:hypothetical protein